jgi:hypothetical protein
MTSLLKTCLSKNQGGSAMAINSQIKNLQETGKLKHNVTLVCDRISKGNKIEL